MVKRQSNNGKRRTKSASKTAILNVYSSDEEESNKITRRGTTYDDEGTTSNTFLANDRIDAEDDEDIEEEDAFNDSDEDRYGEYFASKKSKTDTDEEEVEDDDDFEDDDGAINLSDMVGKNLPDDDDEEEEEQDLDDIEYSESEDEEEEYDQSKAENLVNLVKSMSSSQKAEPKNRKAVSFTIEEERTEAYKESEFNVGTSSTSKLELKDLLQAFDQTSGFGGLKRKLEQLDDKKAGASGALPAPLPKRAQDKINREAAKKTVHKEISKWQPIVEKNRKVEHLKFPLNDPGRQNVTSASLAAKFTPETEMESEIAKLLDVSCMDDKKIRQGEDLEMQKLSIEEVEARRSELAKMRSLLFYQEQKLKRIAKIKSKKYRKIRKKEKQREDAKMAELMKNDEDPEDQLEERKKLEAERALMRMTLRNQKTGKWAQKMIQCRSVDDFTRQELNEQLNRAEDLKRKIQGLEDGEESEDFDDENSEDGENEGEEFDFTAKSLKKLENQVDNDISEPLTQKGVFGMKFMRDAVERQKTMVKDSIKEALDGNDSDDDKGSEDESPNSEMKPFVENPGRITFNAPANPELNPISSTESRETKDIAKGFVTKASAPLSVKSTNSLFEVEPFQGAKEIPCLKFNQETAAGVNESSSGDEEDNDQSVAVPEAFKEHSEVSIANTKVPSDTTKVEKYQDESSSDGEDDGEMVLLDNVKESKLSSENIVLQQRDLIERAFANDNVVQEFEAEKEKIMEAEAPKVKDLTLPGWGCWGGSKIPVVKNKIVRQIPGIDPAQRKDANLKHAIINEKKLKLPEKYQVKSIPHGFQTRAQYERTLDLPLGKEWNTTSTFQKLVKPRVITKAGTIIDPIKYPKSRS